MGSNVHSFNLAVAKRADDVPKWVEQIHQAAAQEALRNVVKISPVDTGRFKGNWQQTTESPATGTLETTDKDGGATIAAGAAVIGTIRPYSVSWLVNNLPYAAALEHGHSRQAPRGMLAVTANRLAAWLARVK